MQVGWDTRSGRLAKLEAATRSVADAVKVLLVAGPYAPATVAFAKDIGKQGMSSGQIFEEACTLASIDCNPAQPYDALPRFCSSFFNKNCADRADFVAVARAYWEQHCVAANVDKSLHAACAVAGPMRDSLELQPQAELLDRVLGNKSTVAAIWQIYSYLAPDEAKKCDKPAECIKNNATAIADAIGDFVRNAPLERRDMLMFAIQDHFDIAVLFSASFSYDRASVYHGDLASSPTDDSRYDLQIGPDITVFTKVRGLSFNLRAGGELSRSLGARTVQRCESLPSTSMTITGTACDANALFRAGSAPAATTSMYVRAAVDYQFQRKLGRHDRPRRRATARHRQHRAAPRSPRARRCSRLRSRARPPRASESPSTLTATSMRRSGSSRRSCSSARRSPTSWASSSGRRLTTRFSRVRKSRQRLEVSTARNSSRERPIWPHDGTTHTLEHSSGESETATSDAHADEYEQGAARALHERRPDPTGRERCWRRQRDVDRVRSRLRIGSDVSSALSNQQARPRQEGTYLGEITVTAPVVDLGTGSPRLAIFVAVRRSPPIGT